jgi:hypothetical protein
MKVTLSVPDKVAAPRTARATWSFVAAYESVSQVVRIDWGDGTPLEQIAAGTLTRDHVYPRDDNYVVVVWGNDVSASDQITVGNRPVPFFDPNRNPTTIEQRQKREAQETQNVLNNPIKAKLGRPGPTRLRRIRSRIGR